MLRITAGVDIGGTNTAIGFIDEEGKYLFGSSIPTNSDENVEKYIIRLADTIKILFAENTKDYQLAGIGFAAPSANYFKGTIEAPSNLNWGSVNFIQLMKKHFDLPIAIINDANAAALGEQAYGLAKGMRNFILITLGTGLGSGIIVDNHLLYGSSGHAGEIGHTTVEPGGRHCNCGRKGCLETYVSASGIKRTVFHLLGHQNENSKLREISFNQLTGEMISELAHDGDPIALSAFDITGDLLGRSLADVIACFEPEAIILFGGLANSGDLLLNPVRSSVEKNLLSIYKGNVKILKSSLQNGMAAILGASSLIKSEIKQSGFIEFKAGAFN